MKDIVTGLYIRDCITERLAPIKPWKRACWDEDGRPVPCDRDSDGGRCCHHDQWVRVAGDGAMLAWVEPAEKHPGEFEAYARDPAAEEHIELCTRVGDRFRLRWAAKRAADVALVENIMRHKEAQAR